MKNDRKDEGYKWGAVMVKAHSDCDWAVTLSGICHDEDESSDVEFHSDCSRAVTIKPVITENVTLI